MLVTGAYDAYLRSVRRAYHLRRDLLVDAVARGLPGARIRGIAAGLHAIVELPRGLDEAVTTDRLRRASIGVHSLTFYLRSDAYPPGLVVGYAAESDHKYPMALEALISRLG
jgi:GntR family transcriptional regulator / MocR family aminotransferase